MNITLSEAKFPVHSDDLAGADALDVCKYIYIQRRRKKYVKSFTS